MRTYQRLAAFVLAAALMLGGCSTGGNTTQPAGDTPSTPSTPAAENSSNSSNSADNAPLKDIVIAKLATRELETFCSVHSQRAEDGENLVNLTDPLLEVDNYGRMIPCIAEKWGTEDGGLTWIFNLRQGVKWVDVNGEEMADCNAHDFATGLEFVLNFHKNDSINTSMPMELIKGATEYYNFTKELSKEEALALDMSKFYETVGMELPDDYTIIYTCTAPKPYFDTVANYSCLYPISQKLIDNLGGPEGYLAMNNQTMWYNGAYLMPTYIQGNEKVFKANPKYWDTNCQRFDSITFKMVESNDVAYQMWQAGEIDHVDLTESNLKTISGNPNHEFYNNLVEKRPTSYSYQFHFNYDKMKNDGTPDTNWNTAIANKAFRLSWYYGLDLTNYYKRTNAINPLKCENDFYTMKNFVYTSDGTDYVDLVRERLGLGTFNGESMVRYNKAKAEEYKAQAIEELTAKGVTFPVEIDYYISASSQTALDSANVLKQVFSDSLGDDYVKLNINTYVSSLNKEVRDPHLQSFVINGWGADYNDPQNYLVQETYGNDNAWYSTSYSNINNATDEELIAIYKEYTDLVTKADAIYDDMDARYNAFADAEAFLLENALVLPCNYSISWSLTRINEYSYKSSKLKNWETSKDAYTTAQYEQFAADYETNSK